MPNSVTDIIRSASANTGKPFDEVLLRYIVLGMQSATMRETLEARLQAEDFKGLANRNLLSRCASALTTCATYLSRLSRGTREPDVEQKLLIEFHSLLKGYYEFERKAVTTQLPRSGESTSSHGGA
ncbi:hypothetical protein [Caballeronia sp. J97]|uniref:hypothetical protein n=1 Tax=Caballeronia sp. J97 TaxID=2805429 RepID=UPI002AAF7C71|nr:hypothetical protein [Caballeronia sp. J97]